MRHEVKIVKFTKKDFLNTKNGIIEIDEWIAVEENDLLHHTQVKSIPEVHVTDVYKRQGQRSYRAVKYTIKDRRCCGYFNEQ